MKDFKFLIRNILFLLFISNTGIANSAVFRVSKKITPDQKVKILDVSEQIFFNQLTKQSTIIRSTPYYLIEGPGTDNQTRYIEELKTNLSPSEKNFLTNKYTTTQDFINAPQIEVRHLVTTGPAANRIHLTILGDGYTLNEKEKFFEDAERITKNLFTDDTFSSYLPLFQVHAIFVPSNVSGIGDGGPINTAFKLYRSPQGSKRAIMPGDESALEKALSYTSQTDYPIVIANDDFYGGLGGRYAISTRSVRSGMIVLRHELGHNFGNVGEEYDGGSVYNGANSSYDAKANQWSQWRTDVNSYDAKLISGNYIWQNLKNKSYKTSFISKPDDTLGFEISTVGWSSPDDVYVYLNGAKINLGGEYHNDRNFYTLDNLQLKNGQNTLEVKENLADGDNILATAFLYSYPKNYNFKKDVTASFATYNAYGSKSYRPTHDGCLMRNMMLKHFCSVDKENMWHNFLNRVSLVDNVIIDSNKVEIQTPELVGLNITWYDDNNNELSYFRNNKVLSKKALANIRSLKVVVELKTLEVRKYDQSFRVEKVISL